MVHAFKDNRGKGRKISEFDASPVYIARGQPELHTENDPVSKKKREKRGMFFLFPPPLMWRKRSVFPFSRVYVYGPSVLCV